MRRRQEGDSPSTMDIDSKTKDGLRVRSIRPHLSLAAVIAILAVAGATIGAIAGSTASPNIAFIFSTPPKSLPSVPPPGSASNCVMVPQHVALSAAHVSFQVFGLASDPNATLTDSQYAQGCSGTLGLDLNYSVSGYDVEIVEAQASSTGPTINLKGNGSNSLAEAGWTTTDIAGVTVAVHSAPGGKGLASGIDLAFWQVAETQFTLSTPTRAPENRAVPITESVLQEIVTDLSAA